MWILWLMKWTAILALAGGMAAAVVACFLMTWREMGWYAVLLWWVAISCVVTLISQRDPNDIW